MDKRQFFNLAFYLLTFLFILAALMADQLSICKVKEGKNNIPTSSNIVYTYNMFTIVASEFDTMSQPNVILGGYSYDGATILSRSIPKYPGNIPSYAKTSYISEILALSFLLILLIVYLKTENSGFFKTLAGLVTITLILASIMATILHSEAAPLKFLDAVFDTNTGVQIETCTLANSAIFSWVAVSTWLVLIVERVGFHATR